MNKNNIEYIATGWVLGSGWGGGLCEYPAREIKNNNYKDLINEIKSSLKDGSLDSGMGFEKLLKADIRIEKKTYKTIKNKIYCHTDTYLKHFINK